MLTAAQKLVLAGNSEYQRLIAADPELDALQAQLIDRGAELYLLMEMLGNPVRVAGVTVQPLTPAVWALLCCMGNAYARQGETPEEADADVYMWLLSRGVRSLDCEIADIPALASGFCRKAGLTFETADAEIRQQIALSFSPLSALPGTGGGEDVFFGADWLARITSEVSAVTAETAKSVMYDMPVSACCAYYVHARRRAGDTILPKLADGEIAKKILARTRELGEKFCKYHNIKG